MRVLVAEDDAVSRRILRAHLSSWGYEAVTASDGAEALRILSEPSPPRLAILDWVMPEKDGVEVVQEVRQLANHPFIYTILLTMRGNADDLIRGFEAGADDYLTKPYNQAELRVRLATGKRLIELQRQLESANARLAEMVRLDSLTQIPNHRAIMDQISSELSRANRLGSSMAVIMVDLDHFKKVNDTYGHIVGDLVLVEIAQRLSKTCREYDAVGRYGGEEFAVLIPGVDQEGLRRVGERLLEAIRSQPVEAEGQRVTVTASAGAIWVSGQIALGPLDVVNEADMMLYQAKGEGRDRLVMGDAVAAVPRAT